MIYRVEVRRPTALRVRAESALGPVLELRRGCSAGHAPVACDAGTGGPERASLEALLTPGQVYTLVVDTRRPGDGGVSLDVRMTPARR